MQAKLSIPQTDQRFARQTLEIDTISGARLAKEKASGHGKAEATRYVQNERKSRIAMGGALSSLEKVLALKVLSDSMVAWESIGTEMIGDSRTERIVI
jgi:hypothetical protein